MKAINDVSDGSEVDGDKTRRRKKNEEHPDGGERQRGRVDGNG